MKRETEILNHTMELLIPDRDRYGKPIDAQSVIDELSSLIGKSFGGLQIFSGAGICVDPNGKPIHENLTVLKSSFNTESLPELAAILINYALSLSKDLNQSEIAMEIDGTFVSVATLNSTENSKKIIIRRIRRKNKQRKKRHLNKRRKHKC